MDSPVFQTDEQAWLAYPAARAFYDRRWLAGQLGYVHGPTGTNPSKPGWYFVKPICNLYGMGVGAGRQRYSHGTEFGVPPGCFWSECFEGEHLSIDYHWSRRLGRWVAVCCVKGIFAVMVPVCWILQPRGRSLPELPDLFGRIAESSDACRINVEFIGGKIIECHLRSGLGDWRGSPAGATKAVPVWEGMRIPGNMVPNEDDGGGLAPLRRLGFVYE